MQQDKDSKTAHFITLTYDTDHVPISKNGFLTLSKGQQSDLTLFFKRLRKAHDNLYRKLRVCPEEREPIKYYACGEYGSKTQRPHYHILVFNCFIELIDKAWGLGEVHYGTVTDASVGYTLKYMTKPGKIPMHARDDRQKEFSVMSKGIGIGYLKGKMPAWHKRALDERLYIPILDGKKIAMPRYYKDKIYSEMERKRIAFFASLREVRESEMNLRDMAEAHAAAFKKFYQRAELNRNKI